MAKFTSKQLEYLKDKNFLEQYLLILNNRLVYSNNRIEYDVEEVDKLYDSNNVLSLEDNLDAFKILLSKLDSKEELTEELIIKVANTVNKHALYISDNYRVIGDNVKFDNTYPIEKPSNIKRKMQELLYKYNNEWSKLDIFEREALFNIEFIRIHPFEDGNGRTSRLLLNYNMLRNGHAPILIPATIRDKYFKERNKENVSWIKQLFIEESKKESIALDNLIDSYIEKSNTSNKRR